MSLASMLDALLILLTIPLMEVFQALLFTLAIFVTMTSPFLFLAAIARIWPDARWARLCNRPIGPHVSSSNSTRERVLGVIAHWVRIGSYLYLAFIITLLLGYWAFRPEFPLQGNLSTCIWVVILITEFVGAGVSILEGIRVGLRLLYSPPPAPPRNNEAFSSGQRPHNTGLNPAAGGTAPAESPRRALARRGLCMR